MRRRSIEDVEKSKKATSTSVTSCRACLEFEVCDMDLLMMRAANVHADESTYSRWSPYSRARRRQW